MNINSESDNLADIVGMNAIIEPASTSPLWAVLLSFIITALSIFIYYQFFHGLKGQLRRLKSQLNQAQITPRLAAHKIAFLIKHQSLSDTQNKILDTLRFAPKNPSTEQVIDFINRVD